MSNFGNNICNPFGQVANDRYYTQLQAPCSVNELFTQVNNNGDTNLIFVNDVNTTIPIDGIVNTTGTGGNVTVGDDTNNFAIYHLRSLSQFVVGNVVNTSEYQDLQTALNATTAVALPVGTFNVVYLQPGIQYTGNITIPNGVVLRGQEGAQINGNVTIPAAATVFLFDAIIVGTVTTQGQTVTFVNSVVEGGASLALDVISGGVNSANSSFSNNAVLNPTIRIDGGGTIDINNAVIQNRSGNGYAVRMLDSYIGPAYFRTSRFPEGQQRFVNRTVISNNYFDSTADAPVALELNNQSGTILEFLNNVVQGQVNVTKDNSASDCSIIVNGNVINGSQVTATINNSPAVGGIFYPHVQFRDNTISNAAILTTFTNNTDFGLVIYDNNYIGLSSNPPSVNHNYVSGAISQVTMINNQIPQNSVVYNNVVAFLQGNIIENPVSPPFQLTYNLGANTNSYLINNWLSTRAQPVPTIQASLSGSTHTLQIMQNSLLTDTAPQDLFDVTLAGGATFISDAQNDNINASANLFSPPAATIGTV